MNAELSLVRRCAYPHVLVYGELHPRNPGAGGHAVRARDVLAGSSDTRQVCPYHGSTGTHRALNSSTCRGGHFRGGQEPATSTSSLLDVPLD